MTPFERLKTLVEWNLSDNVLEENIDMNTYMDYCGTSGCRLGWGATCPALIQEGYSLERVKRGTRSCDIDIAIDNVSVDFREDLFLKFFGMSVYESRMFFSPVCEGTKKELQSTWRKYLKSKGMKWTKPKQK